MLAIADSAVSGLAALVLTAIGQMMAIRSSRGRATAKTRGPDGASAAAGIAPAQLATLTAAVAALTEAIVVLGSRRYVDLPPGLWAASNALVAIAGWAADTLADGTGGGGSAGVGASGGDGGSSRPTTAAQPEAAAVQQQRPPPAASAAATAAAASGPAAGLAAGGEFEGLLSHAVSGALAVGGWVMLTHASTAANSRPAGVLDASERLAKV